MRAGARGYLLKGAAPGEVERAVRAVANGEVLLGPDVAARAMAYLAGARTAGPVPFPDLTDREREVLDLVARGLDNASIARRLDAQPQDGAQPPVEHPHQAGRGRPGPGHRPRSRRRPGWRRLNAHDVRRQ